VLRKCHLDPNTNDRINAKYISKKNITKNIWPNTRWRTLAPGWNNELYSLYNDLNVVKDIKIRRLGWAGLIMRMEEETIPPPPKKRFLMGNSITQDQWEDQEPDGRILFIGMHYRC